MAHVGMKYPVAAPLDMDKTKDGTVAYKVEESTAFVIGKAINFTGTPNKNDVNLYADDEIAETDKTQRDWGVSLNVDDLTLEVQSKLLGHTYKKAEIDGIDGATEKMVIGTDDVPPYFGVGFYKRRRKNNVTSFTAIWLYKVQFSEPTENAETKGDTVNFQTPTIEGTAYPVEVTEDTKKVMSVGYKVTFDDEAKCKTWLNKMITPGE